MYFGKLMVLRNYYWKAFSKNLGGFCFFLCLANNNTKNLKIETKNPKVDKEKIQMTSKM